MNHPAANPKTPHRWVLRLSHPILLCLLLAGATGLAFWPVVHADFINYDDNDYVTLNPRVQAGLTWKNAAWAFTSNHASNWHPLTWLSHMLDVELFGKSPTGPHCINLLLHVCNAVFLFLLLKKMTASRWRSYLVAALFALHPAHVESVAWIAERKDVLSTLFFMLTLLAYAQFVAQSKTPGIKVKAFYALTLLLFLLGLMSKPMLVTLPFVMLLLDLWPLQRFTPWGFKQQKRTILRLILEKTPFFLFSAASCAVTTWAQEKAMPSLQYLSLSDRVANTVVSYSRYLGKAFWPTDLAIPYLHPGQWPAAQVTLATLLVAGLCLLATLTIRKQPFIFAGWFWFLGTLVPVIGLVQVGAQAIADRYTYIPLIGIFIASTWIATDWLARRHLHKAVGPGLAILMVASCGMLTRKQAAYWHNGESLFKHSASVTEGNYIALGNVGGALFEAKRLDEAMIYYQSSHAANSLYPESINSIGAVLAAKGKDDEAIGWFRQTLEIQPTHVGALFNLGNAMAKKGDLVEAAKYFKSALAIEPDNHEARNNLGNTLLKLGNLDETIEQYRLALEITPEATLIRKNLGEVLAAKGKLEEAIAQYRQVLLTTNDAGTHYSLGLTRAVQGKWTEAIEHYRATLRLAPNNAEAHYNLGYALRMQRQPEEAVKQLREAIRLKSEFPLAQFNLGCALVELRQPREAAAHFREALRLKPDYKEAQQKLQALETGGHDSK